MVGEMAKTFEWWIAAAEQAYTEADNKESATAAALIAISKILAPLVEDLFDDDFSDDEDCDDEVWVHRGNR
jgi:hypothetical protein